MNPLKLNEAKELNKLLGGELSEAYKEIARLRAKNAQRDKLKAAVVSDLQKNLELEKEKSKKFQRKIAVLQRKLSDKKREKTELRIELNRTKIEHRTHSKIRRASKIPSTSTVRNPEWSTEESLKNSISNQASIKPQTVFKGIYAHPLRSVDLGSIFGSTGLVSERRLEKLKRRETARWTRMKKVRRLVNRPLDLSECFPPQEPQPINLNRSGSQ